MSEPSWSPKPIQRTVRIALLLFVFAALFTLLFGINHGLVEFFIQRNRSYTNYSSLPEVLLVARYFVVVVIGFELIFLCAITRLITHALLYCYRPGWFRLNYFTLLAITVWSSFFIYLQLGKETLGWPYEFAWQLKNGTWDFHSEESLVYNGWILLGSIILIGGYGYLFDASPPNPPDPTRPAPQVTPPQIPWRPLPWPFEIGEWRSNDPVEPDQRRRAWFTLALWIAFIECTTVAEDEFNWLFFDLKIDLPLPTEMTLGFHALYGAFRIWILAAVLYLMYRIVVRDRRVLIWFLFLSTLALPLYAAFIYLSLLMPLIGVQARL